MAGFIEDLADRHGVDGPALQMTIGLSDGDRHRSDRHPEHVQLPPRREDHRGGQQEPFSTRPKANLRSRIDGQQLSSVSTRPSESDARRGRSPPSVAPHVALLDYLLGMTTPVVTVRGEAELVCPPDLATLSATVHATGSDPDEVRRQLAAASARIREIVETHQQALERHGTSGLHVGPTFSGRGGRRISGYRGSLGTELVVADLAALPAILAAITALDGAQVNGPWWSLRPTNPIHRQVRIAAIAEARQRAADYAAAFDAVLGALVEVSDLEGRSTRSRG